MIVVSHAKDCDWLQLTGATTNCVIQGISSDEIAVKVWTSTLALRFSLLAFHLLTNSNTGASRNGSQRRAKRQYSTYFTVPNTSSTLEHSSYAVDEIVKVAVVNAGDVDTAGPDQVDAVVINQCLYLSLVDAEEGEHAFLALNEAEVLL